MPRNLALATLTGSADDVVNGDIHPLEPSVRAFMRLFEEDAAL
jgi:hypothetical protein